MARQQERPELYLTYKYGRDDCETEPNEGTRAFYRFLRNWQTLPDLREEIRQKYKDR